MIRINRSKMLAAGIALTCASPMLSSAAHAVIATASVGFTINLNGAPIASGNSTTIPVTNGNFSTSGNGTFNDGQTFTYSYSGNEDPLLNWSFSTTEPGAYTMTFTQPVSGGPYTTAKNQASLTLSDGGGANGSSVTGVSFLAQDPISSTISAISFSGVSGDSSVAAGGLGGMTYGPLSTTGSFTGTSMDESIAFTLTSADNDGSAGFVGQFSLAPEPASLTLLGAAVAPLLLKRKR